VGSAIGVAVVVLVGAFGVLWCVKRRRQRREYMIPTHEEGAAKLSTPKKGQQLASSASGSTAFFGRLFSRKVRMLGV
jgi:hypothetical protein